MPGPRASPIRGAWSTAVAGVLLGVLGCRAGPERYTFQEAHMGTVFRIVLYADSEARALQGAEGAFARIADLEAQLSDYDPESELSRLSGRTAWQRVSPDLWRNLQLSKRIGEASEGAFDVTLGALSRVWRRARRKGQAPPQARLDEALSQVGFASLELDAPTRSVRLLEPDMRLDLGGIAKGDALDEALSVLRAHGIERALVDGGGDLALGAPPPGLSGWSVALPRGGPGDTGVEWIRVAHAGVATSGDTERGFVYEGQRYSHLIDPRTGLALVDSPIVTVLAPTGAEADAWASALSVSGARGLKALVRFGGEARLLPRGGADGVKMTTAGFPERLSSKAESALGKPRIAPTPAPTL